MFHSTIITQTYAVSPIKVLQSFLSNNKITRSTQISAKVYTARRQKCTRGLNCTDPKLHECTKLHEDKIARRQKYTRGLNCTKTILHGGSKLHGDNFAQNTTNLKYLSKNWKNVYLL